jgi:hypothetical protein
MRMNKKSLKIVGLLLLACWSFSGCSRSDSSSHIIKGQLIGSSQLVDAGNTTPESALESDFWRESNSNRAKFTSFQGLQILASKKVASNQVELKYRFEFQNSSTPQKTKIIEMVKINGAWQVGQTRAYDASWDDGSELEPMP